MSVPGAPLLFDRTRLRGRRDRAASRFADYAFLKTRVSNELIERLGDTSHSFARALDLGCHTGQLAGGLRAERGIEEVVAADFSPGMLAEVRRAGLTGVLADEERLPFEAASFDLVASALSLHWANDLPGALIQIRQVLRPDGLFLGALFGAGTLGELRTCLMEAEAEMTGGAAARVSPLPGLQDMAGLMQRAGFALPVVDIDRVKVRYDTPFGLLKDLGGMGERACFADGPGRALSRAVLARMAEIYAERFSDPDGRVRASFEIVYLSGWAPAPNQPQPKRPGSAKLRLADALGTVEHKVKRDDGG